MDTKDQDQDHQKSSTPQPSTQTSNSTTSNNNHHSQNQLDHNRSYSHYTHIPHHQHHHLQNHEQSQVTQDDVQLSRTVSPVSINVPISIPSLCRHNSSSDSIDSNSFQLSSFDKDTNNTILPEITIPKTPPPIDHNNRRNNNGTFSNFQLPNDILKNLTPVIKSPPRDKSKNQLLRNNHIKNIQLRLNNQNNKINKTIKDLKIETTKKIEFQTFKLNENYKIAKFRRENYLNLIKERAGKFITNNNYNNNDKGRILSAGTENKEYGKSRINSVNSLKLHFNIPFSHISPSTIENITNFQSRSRQYLLRTSVKFLQQSNFLKKFNKMPFNQVLTCLNSESSIKKSLCFVLKYLNITKDVFETKIFLYCFIMISDFNDCMQNGPYQPGFNHNINYDNINSNSGTFNSNEESNFFNNFIWVLLFKYSTYLLEEFTNLVHGDNQPMITCKLQSYWEDYKFIFKIFKWNHYLNIKKILYSSISIVDQQLKILNNNNNKNNPFDEGDNINNDIFHQKERMTMELNLLDNYNLKSLQEFNSSARVKNFKEKLSNKINDIYLSYKHYNKSNSRLSTNNFIQNKANYICYNNLKFHIPHFLPLEKWRSYWRAYYFENNFKDNNNNHECESNVPLKLKSGYLGEINSYYYNGMSKFDGGNRYINEESKINYFELIDSMIDVKSVTLKEIYEILFNYYIQFSSIEEFPNDDLDSESDYEETFEFIEYSINDESNFDHDIEYFNKIKSLFKHYDQLNKFNHIINNENNHQKLDNEIILQLKYEILIQYLNKCHFGNGSNNDFTKFKKFENLITIFNLSNFKNLKFSIYTLNPQLLFPKFYKKFMMRNHYLSLIKHVDYLEPTLVASSKYSLNRVLQFESTHNLLSFKFFNNLFINHMLNIDKCLEEGKMQVDGFDTVDKEDEILSNFESDFLKYNQELKKLLKLNCFGIMYKNYFPNYSNVLQSSIINLFTTYEEYYKINTLDLSSSAPHTDLSQTDVLKFFNYYHHHNENITQILSIKWLDLMKEKTSQYNNRNQTFNLIAYNDPNFKFYVKEINELSNEIFRFSSYLYEVYNPILNWIYEDLAINNEGLDSS
ncbi:hypothetical protein KGF54_004546 [Candida jiufengensis]|uniref:uncharacterized protein n=1 Tax=Candida jiufengensis TaxID=497108 RepID=UPI0022256AD1|nr:uncharacterized protein KGF54_004546 [Candida jiufengensis]KAI5951472.1 hypothetical protein KGF54_004546 [Candida jiufengensis]